MMKFDFKFCAASVCLSVCVMLSCGWVHAQDDAKMPLEVQDKVQEKNKWLGLEKPAFERLAQTLREAAFSTDDLICLRAFKMFANHPPLHRHLGEGVELELVKQGFDSVYAQEFALQILKDSKIKGLERQDLLLKVLVMSIRIGNASEMRESAASSLLKMKAEVFDRISVEFNQDPLGDHKSMLRLVEYLGPQARAILPNLKAKYQAIKKQSLSDSKPADYLDVLLAIGEIESPEGMGVILDACGETHERREYALVGLAFLDKILSVTDPTKVKVLSDSQKARYVKYAESLMSSYDKDKDKRLSQAEAKAMRRPPVGSDADGDGFITIAELQFFLTEGKPTSSGGAIPKREGSLIRNRLEVKGN